MEKKNKRTLILSVIICLLPMVLGIAFYNRLPEQMPIHFTINDVPDNYAQKILHYLEYQLLWLLCKQYV